MLDFTTESAPDHSPISQRHSTWIAVLAGLVTAMAAAILVCRSPQAATPQLTLILLAASYIMVTAFSGATGSFLFWARSQNWSQTLPASQLAPQQASQIVELIQSTAAGWVWIPAIVLLSRQDSIWAPTVAAAGSVVLAVSLRRSSPTTSYPSVALESAESTEPAQPEIFSQILKTPAAEWYGPTVAICLFGELVVLAQGWLFPACLLLAVAGFVFAWARTPTALTGQQSIHKLTVVTVRQTKSALPALIVTVLALMIGASHDIQEGFGFGAHRGAGDSLVPPKTEASLGVGGHVSIVLLTGPQKQQFYMPQKQDPLLRGTRLIKPMVLPFDGEYWYFQWPDDGPGPRAFKAHGSPLGTSIHANSTSEPLTMQAHQHLSSPLPLECCREIDVEIESHAGQNGAMAMGMTLIDSATAGRQSLVLEGQAITTGQQAGSSSQAGQPTFTHSTLRFHIPAQKGPSRMRQFDQVDFAIITDPAHAHTGAKMAIRTLEFIP